jgi:hypothetical protein
MRTSAALSATLAWLFLAQFASAQTPASAAPAQPSAPAPAAATEAAPAPVLGNPALIVVPAEPDQPVLEPIPSARDTLGGHFVLGAAVGPKWPFGSLESGRKQSSFLGTGLALNLDLGYGVGRSLVLGAWGELDLHAKRSSSCLACSEATSFAVGPFLRYHLVQGTRFDPWGELAVGIRYTNTTPPTSDASKKYFGPELLKLTLGGDWYPTSNIGFGPYVTLDLGTYHSTVHSGFGTGLRLVLDLPGK